MYVKYKIHGCIMDIPKFKREYSFWYRHLIRTLEQENLQVYQLLILFPKSSIHVQQFVVSPLQRQRYGRNLKSKHLFCTMQQNDILTCPKPIVGTVLGYKFRIIRCLSQPAKTAVSPRFSPLGTFHEEERLRLSDRNSILMS